MKKRVMPQWFAADKMCFAVCALTQ